MTTIAAPRPPSYWINRYMADEAPERYEAELAADVDRAAWGMGLAALRKEWECARHKRKCRRCTSPMDYHAHEPGYPAQYVCRSEWCGGWVEA